jgi:hypothetical protein
MTYLDAAPPERFPFQDWKYKGPAAVAARLSLISVSALYFFYCSGFGEILGQEKQGTVAGL